MPSESTQKQVTGHPSPATSLRNKTKRTQATAASHASLRRSHTSNTILMNSGLCSFNLLEDFSFFLHNSWATIKNKRSKSGLCCCCVSHSVVSNSLRPHGLYSPWNSLGQNTGVVAFPFSRGSSQLNPGSPAGRFFTN